MTDVDSSTLLLEEEETDHHNVPDFYEGPTTKSEIFGWCLYSWATEPFVVSCISTYVPLLLEQFARDNGVLSNDYTKSCKVPHVQPIPPSTNNNDTNIQEVIGCVVNVFGYYIDPSAFTLYCFSLSVFLQTLIVISITGFADKGNYKKALLLIFGFIGSFITINFYFLETENYYKAGLYAILANICYGAVNVCGNSFLPILVENYKLSNEPRFGVDEKAIISSKISGLCSGLGYFAAFVAQVITMIIVLKTGSKIISIQYAILFIGIWWLIFQLPIIWTLKSRKINNPVSLTSKFLKSNWNHYDKKNHSNNKILALILRKIFFFKEYILIGWKNLGLAIQQITLLKDVCIFLCGWFVISDSITTINSAAILFSKTELKMETHELALIGIITILSAICGTIIVPNYLNNYLKIPLRLTFLIIIIWAQFIPLYGILGFFFDSFGLKHKQEMYLLAFWYGLSLGGLSTISRSLFGLLIPKGKESLFFALFAVTDKGSSILGPLFVGLITDKTHNIRYCFWFLWGLLIISLPIFSLLDLERGKDEAARFDELVEGTEYQLVEPSE